MPRLKPMAFHVACPITCRLICDCELGFPEELRSPRARREFEEQGERLEEFLKDPWLVRAGSGGGGGGTVQVLVPKVVPTPAPPLPPSTSVDHGGGGDDALSSAHVWWAALQRQAVAASMAAEDYVRRLEAGGAAEVPGEAANTLVTEDQCSSIKVMCRICFSGESEGSERAMKMLPCKFCHKKYHRSCLKVWAEHRDLFHWSSWACPSCRICEICRRVGDPTKLMFCKRCDGAYHCYCQQPPHKNVSHGPYLCPKHTRCHSCGSTVPGSGLSTRWFLGYTCCDACGRLFVKGKYCPVCLKVYRDSEMTPMVCCDVCQQWVHCVCDGISDEKYQQFQADGNLYYKCLACRGDCYQVKDMEDAVRELWRRRDKADRDLTASLRAAAGLPTQEEIFSICPYSDDEETSPVIPKNDYGRSSKISVKSLTDKASKNSKEHGINFSKRSSGKKYTSKGHQVQFSGKSEEPYQHNERQHVVRSPESSLRDPKFDETKPYRNDAQAYFSSPLTRSLGNDKGKSSFDQMGSNNQMFIEEGVGNNSDKMPKVHIKCSKSPGLHVKEGVGKESSKTETVKGTKLVIHFGAKNRNAPPKSDASSFHKDQDVNASKGSEGMSELVMKESKNYVVDSHPVIARNHDGKGAKLENSTQIKSSRHGDREDSVIKLRKISETHRKRRANIAECEPMTACRSPLIIRKTSTEVDPAIKTRSQTTWTHNDDLPGNNSLNTTVNLQSEIHNVPESPFTSKSSDDPKPLLKLKFKNPFFEHRNSWAPSEGEEKNPVKGQRSKRKRPLFHKENNQVDDNKAQPNQEDPIDEVGDANWILQKLGKDAIGKSRSS